MAQQQQYGSQEPMSQQSTMGMQPSGTGQQGQQYGEPQQIGGQQGQIGQQGQYGQQPGQMMQQPGQMAHQPSGGLNITLEEGISDEMRVALHDFVQATNACEWCAEQCIDEGPEMGECLRLCRDVADLGALNIQLLARDSVFGPEVAEVFAQAAEACAQECAQHPQKHCQECAEVLPRAARSTRKMLASFGGGQGTRSQAIQFGQTAGGQF